MVNVIKFSMERCRVNKFHPRWWAQRIFHCFFILRSSHQRCSVRKGVLRNLAKFTRKHLCQSLFFNKVAGPTTLSKKRDWHSCFLMNFAKFLRTPFSQNTSRRLLFHNLKILFSLFERMLDQFVWTVKI